METKEETAAVPPERNPAHAALHFLLDEHKIHKPEHAAKARQMQDALHEHYSKEAEAADHAADSHNKKK
jgi:hypothetical protein